MIPKLAQYKVRQAEVPVVQQAISKFVKAIAQNEQATTYEAYQCADGVSSLHIMAFLDSPAERKHQTADDTRKFVEVLYPRCEASGVGGRGNAGPLATDERAAVKRCADVHASATAR